MEMLKSGMDITSIAKERQLTRWTIVNHIDKYFSENEGSDIEINFDEFFTSEEEEVVLSAIEKAGMEKLAPIKELLPENISYDIIRMVILKHFRVNNNN
jgi:ATP-dependent DNA helicase RecQ